MEITPFNLSLPAETIDSLLLWLDDKQGIIIKQTDLLSGTGQSTTATMTQRAITDAINAGYLYKGVATPATNPGTPDANVFYLASEAGTYTNFDSIVINEGEVCALVWNGTWTKEVTGIATAAQVSQLGQKVTLLEGGSIDLSDGELGFIKGDGTWDLNDGSQCVLFHVAPGNVVAITANASYQAIVAEIATNDKSSAPSFLIPRTAIASGSRTFEIDSEGYFYVSKKNSAYPDIDYTPASCVVSGTIDSIDSRLGAVENSEAETQETIFNLIGGDVDVSVVSANAIITSAGVWENNPGSSCVLVKVQKGVSVLVTANSTYQAIAAEVASKDTSITPSFLIPRTSIASGSRSFNIENDGYFYIQKINYAYPLIDYTPSKVKVTGIIYGNASGADAPLFLVGSSSIQRMFNQTGTYSLSTLFEGKTLINGGVGGENIRAIGARMGSEGLYVGNFFTIPATATPVSGLTFKVRGEDTVFTNQQGDNLPMLNPVIIGGVPGTIAYNNGAFSFTRTTPGDAVDISEGESVIPSEIAFRNCICVANISNNGGYDGVEDCISFHQNIISHLYGNKYLFISRLVDGSWDNPTNEQLQIEERMSIIFGTNYWNLRWWLSQKGIAYGIAMGLLDSSQYPTEQDNADKVNKVVPHSLRSDLVHLTDIGYKIVNYRLKEILFELGYIEE